jgi:hypothetical protein
MALLYGTPCELTSTLLDVTFDFNSDVIRESETE